MLGMCRRVTRLVDTAAMPRLPPVVGNQFRAGGQHLHHGAAISLIAGQVTISGQQGDTWASFLTITRQSSTVVAQINRSICTICGFWRRCYQYPNQTPCLLVKVLLTWTMDPNFNKEKVLIFKYQILCVDHNINIKIEELQSLPLSRQWTHGGPATHHLAQIFISIAAEEPGPGTVLPVLTVPELRRDGDNGIISINTGIIFIQLLLIGSG